MPDITTQDASEKDFIAYVDDDGTSREIYGTILSPLQEGLFTFRTKGNTITIPIHRLLKIKRPNEARQDAP